MTTTVDEAADAIAAWAQTPQAREFIKQQFEFASRQLAAKVNKAVHVEVRLFNPKEAQVWVNGELFGDLEGTTAIGDTYLLLVHLSKILPLEVEQVWIKDDRE